MGAENESKSAGSIWDHLHLTLGNEATIGGNQRTDDEWYWRSGELTIDRIEKHAGGFVEKSVLDYGCGRGRLACWAIQRCQALTCVDVSPVALKGLRQNIAVRATTKKPVSVVLANRLGDLRAVPSFNVVYAWHVVFHMTTIQALEFICAAYTRLLPGGVLVFNHSNVFHPWCTPILKEAARIGVWRTGEFPYTPMASAVLLHFATNIAGFVTAHVDDQAALQPVITCFKS